MMRSRRAASLGGLAASAGLQAARRAQAVPVLKIGWLTDMSGPCKHLAGPGAVAAARQASAEFNVSAEGFEVELLVADHRTGVRPTMVHAGVYSATLHALKAAAATGIAQARLDGAATVARRQGDAGRQGVPAARQGRLFID